MLPREPQCWSAPRCADTQRKSPGHTPVTDTLSHGGTRDIQERSQIKWVLDAVRIFRTSCYSQTGSFSPAAHPEHSPSFQKSRRAALELVSTISPFLSQPCPMGGLLCNEQLYLTRGALEAVRPKNSQLPEEQESYFRGFKIAAAQIIP